MSMGEVWFINILVVVVIVGLIALVIKRTKS